MRLKEQDIIEIAKMIDDDISSTRIALKFNYSEGTMGEIARRYKKHGLDAILHHRKSQHYSPDFKLEIINRYYSGESICSLAVEINTNHSKVTSWIKKYEQLGYNGLIDNRGRPGVTKMGRPKKNQTKPATQQAPLTDPEREELNELRKRNRRLEMELEATKKLQALVQERIMRQTPKK
jgi:transposase-like protein